VSHSAVSIGQVSGSRTDEDFAAQDAKQALLDENIGRPIRDYEQANSNEEEGQDPFGELFKIGFRCGMAGKTIGERAHGDGYRHCGPETGKNENGF